MNNILPPESAGGIGDLKRGRRRRKVENNGSLNADRLPPHAPEAEQGVLGCILLSPMECLSQVIPMLRMGDEVFYDLRHQTIYASLVQMYDNRKPIDVITLQQRLKDFDMLEQIGGIPYLNTLQDSVPSSANVTYYAELVIEKYLLRRAILVCTDVVGKVYEFQGEVPVLIDEMERDVLAVRQSIASVKSTGMKTLVNEAIVEIEAWMNRSGQLTGIATGFPDLDVMTSGLQRGDMIVIAARPSIGKTSLAMNIADYVAVTNKIPTGVFSLEMTARSLTNRIICSRARVNVRNLREGFATERDFPRITIAAGQISNSPLQIDDTPGLSILDLRARARRMVQQFGIKLFIIDYLQLMNSTSKKARDNRQQEVSEISSGIKGLAKELDVPVIVLSQLNRDIERDKKRKPRLSDLRESGSIEQDADVVGLMYRVALDDEEDVDMLDGFPINLNIAKQRNGPTGEVNLTFLKSYTRFESAAKVSDEDVPRE